MINSKLGKVDMSQNENLNLFCIQHINYFLY